MARKRRGQNIDGWLVVDKAPGMTSTAVVGQVRRLLDAAKAGHGGTLDPLATGLLPIALGEATKTVRFVMDGTKTYRFTVRWGERRDTDDADGAVVEASDARPAADAIAAALPAFIGEIEQLPPRYSALKIDGERAYDLARAGDDFDLEPRIVRADRLELLATPDADTAELEVDSGKGFYVRALARDLAAALGCLGHVAALRRVRAGPFTEAQAISLSQLEALGHSPARLEHVLPVKTALDDIPALAVTGAEAERLRRGQAVQVLRAADLNIVQDLADGDFVCARMGDTLVAIGRLDFGTETVPQGGQFRPVTQLHPVRVLNA